MVANSGKRTKLEVKFSMALKRNRIRGFKANYTIGKTRVDVAFPTQKIAIFVQGCFWHHCAVCDLALPKTNAAFWKRKFVLNKARDARVRFALENSGWNVMEFWEHEINRDVTACVRMVGCLV
jgi:DNA mismatch endonuclease, patch repair protein